MKRIEAIIESDVVADLCSDLETAGLRDVTVSSVERRGSGQEWIHLVRSRSFKESARKQSRVEVIVSDAEAARAVEIMRCAAESRGSGEIIIHNVADVIRIEAGACAPAS